MMMLVGSGHSGRLHGIGRRIRSMHGTAEEAVGVQFNTGLMPYTSNVLRVSDQKLFKIPENTTVRIYFGQMGKTSLPLKDEQGNKYYLLELAPQKGNEFWSFYRESPAAKATLESAEWAADAAARNERLFYTLIPPSELKPYDPDKIVDSYTGQYGVESDVDQRGLEAAEAAGNSKTPTAGTGNKVLGGDKGPAGSGGSGGTGSGGIDIGVPGLGLGPNWKLPDLGSGLVILLLVVGGGLLLTNKAIRG